MCQVFLRFFFRPLEDSHCKWIKYFLGGRICVQVFFRGNILFEVLAPPSVYHMSPPPGNTLISIILSHASKVQSLLVY